MSATFWSSEKWIHQELRRIFKNAEHWLHLSPLRWLLHYESHKHRHRLVQGLSTSAFWVCAVCKQLKRTLRLNHMARNNHVTPLPVQNCGYRGKWVSRESWSQYCYISLACGLIPSIPAFAVRGHNHLLLVNCTCCAPFLGSPRCNSRPLESPAPGEEQPHASVQAWGGPAGEQLCGEGPGCPGRRQVDHEPAVCPDCQEGPWHSGVH